MIIGGCVQIMFVLGSFFPTFFVDRVGRRAPMIWGSLTLGICMMMVAILLSFKGKENEHATSSASIAFFFVYMFAFGASVNCIPWVYVPEILPLHARAKGTAVGISSNWIWVSRAFLSFMLILPDERRGKGEFADCARTSLLS
jgi:MFS family permease